METLYQLIVKSCERLNNGENFYHYIVPAYINEDFVKFIELNSSSVESLNISCQCNEQNRNEDVGVEAKTHWHHIITSKLTQHAIRLRWTRYAKRTKIIKDRNKCFLWFRSRDMVSVAHLSHTYIYIQTENTKGMRAPEDQTRMSKNTPTWKLVCVGHSEHTLEDIFEDKATATKWKKEVLWKRQPAIRVIAEKEWRDFIVHREARRKFYNEKIRPHITGKSSMARDEVFESIDTD